MTTAVTPIKTMGAFTNVGRSIEETKKRFPKFGEEKIPKYCSVCSKKLKETDDVLKDIAEIEKMKTPLGRALSLIAYADKGNITCNEHKNKDPVYCPFHGVVMESMGMYRLTWSLEDPQYTDIQCSECGYISRRLMTEADVALVQNSELINLLGLKV